MNSEEGVAGEAWGRSGVVVTDFLLIKSDSRRTGESEWRLGELVRLQGPRSVSRYVLHYPL